MSNDEQDIDEIIKRGLDAYARIQKAITRIQRILKRIELSPERDDWGFQPAREEMDDVEDELSDISFDIGQMKSAFTDLEEILRGMAMEYKEAYINLPKMYCEG